jgi:nucleotide-binding universal stress UspA family protein
MRDIGASVVVGIRDKQPTALRFALREARRTGGSLRVVHSAGFPIPSLEFLSGAGAVAENVRETGQNVLDDAKHFIDQEITAVSADYVLTDAAPIEALEAEARTARALVVGADDISWPDRLLGGAISEHLSGHAACPVIVVPERAYPTHLSAGVCVALDGDTSADGSLRFAYEQADARDNSLHVLHATPPGTQSKDMELIRANLAEVLAGWSTAYPGVRVMLSFPMADAEEACVSATERAELVVVGRPHGRGLPFSLARPLASRVIRRAHCPVAVVPSDYRGL